ncbi:MAG: outer membrane protein assembly factor BamB [Kistimonas sp.]|nr:outer membrane protein assembly factor BamB [Kistimonas sp.]
MTRRRPALTVISRSRALVHALLGLLLCASMTGCSSTGSSGSQALQPGRDQVAVRVVWRSSPRRTGSSLLGLALLTDRLVVADAHGQVTALATDSGKVLWKRETRYTPGGAPGTDGRRILLGTRDGQVLALDATDGKTLWVAPVSSEALSPPQAADDRIVLQTADSHVFCLNGHNGKLVWEQESLHPVLALRGSPTPATDAGIVYAGFASGQARAWRLDTGQALWEATVAAPGGASELERMVDIHAQPLLDGERVYMVSYQGQAVAMDPATGQLLWSRELSSYKHMAQGFGNLYITNTRDELLALDQTTGAAVWRQDALAGQEISAPAVLGNYVLTGDKEGRLHVFSQSDGQPVGTAKVGDAALRAQPQVAGHSIYVYTEDGSVVALDLNTLD